MSRTSIAVTAWRNGDQSVPPKLQLFLDGKMVGETEVRAYTATGYSFTADLDPSLAHKLQVRYVNDAPGRDLFVGKLQVGAFSIKPTDPGVTYDKGAIDGRDVVAGQEAMWWNGALDFAVPSNVTTPPPATGPDDLVAITVKASGTTQDGQAPRFKLLLDGKLIGEASATSSTSKDYSFTASVAADQAHKIQVQYLNDGPQRDFFIQGIQIGGQEIKSTAPDVIYDKGALDGRDLAKGQEAMWWNGTMVFSVPAGFLTPSASTPTAPAPTVPSPAIPSPTVPSPPAPSAPQWTAVGDRVTVASGSALVFDPLANDRWTAGPSTLTVRVSGDHYLGAPQFRLLVDGQPVGAVQTVSAVYGQNQWESFTFKTTLPQIDQHKVSVEFLNNLFEGSASKDRNLYVQSVSVDGTQFTPASPAQTSNGAKTFTVPHSVVNGKPADPSLIAGKAAHGTVAVTAGGDLSYKPAAGYVGSDSFTYTLRDAAGVTSTATVAVDVKAAAVAPQPVPSQPAPTQPSSDRTASASVSSERPPLSKDVWVKSWGADRGLAPQHLFWETVPDYANASHMALTRDVAADHLAEGVVPVIGMQLWEDTFLKSQPGAQFGSLAGHKAWVSWVEAHPQYLGTNASGKVHYSTTANTEGWGYVSPLMPLDAKDAPAGFTGKTAYYADWLADKLGRLAAHTGTRGFELADFFDGSPHSGVMNYFNPRMIADFSAKTGIAVSGGTLAEQAAWIRAEHPLEWLDYFVKGWSYSWKALTEGIEKHTGQEAWLSNQTSFTPAAMREFAGVDVRELGKVMDLGDLLINVQTLERFTMQHKLAPAAYEQAMLGTHAARAPEGHYGHMLSSSEDDYWNAVNTLYKGVSGTAREELGWDRLEQTWYQSGWTHVAEADGGIRRAAESWSRSYHDWGEVKQGWLDTLRDIVPTRPFGPALYYSANAENAANRLAPTGNDIGNAYLGELLTPITRLHEAGVPFGYYVSDAALGSINASNAPSAWIIPQRYQNGVDLFSDAEIAALKARSPVLVGDEAIGYKHPLTFTDADPGAQITGYGFYDQKDRLIVVASDRVDFDDTASRGALNVHIGLMLKDGRYTAENLETHAKHAFTVTGGNGGFDVDIGRWDTELFAVTPEAA
ncbi:carbohydrate-binding domain-containing protein [Azospirillum sp. SYSU D00513]|uniref:carbohydrate-binding domain-containing protein n=1 Tax=Azospirillum sp. SYSU D00513 TaxID=2812561 RepID=UPI001A95D7D9